MIKWEEVTEKEFAIIFTVYDYKYSSPDGYTDFYEIVTPHNKIFKGTIKEIDKVNHYYLLTK